MTERPPGDSGWFADIAPGAGESARQAIDSGTADAPAAWPALAVEAGFVDDVDAYYAALHEATIAAARQTITELDRADDQQLIHRLRAMDDTHRMANELAERVAEWAGSLDPDADTGIAFARELAAADPATVGDDAVVRLARQVRDLDDEANALRATVERTAPSVAPNLSALAGPVLAARLVALAGGLEALAKLPAGTVQVLGAEEALFAHLRGNAPSPKHGIIFVHEYVRHTAPAERGSAARALAGKLSIAARIDHYSGDHRPALGEELTTRIEHIRARSDPDE